MSKNRNKKRKKPIRVKHRTASKSAKAQFKNQRWFKLAKIAAILATFFGLVVALYNQQWFRLSAKIVVGLATFLGSVVAILSLCARIGITSDSPINPADPFSSPFTLSNKGILPIYNVLFSCTLRDVKWQDGGVMNIRTRTKADPIKRINAGEATTTFCKSLPYKAEIKSADIEVEVTYRPAYLFWSKRSSIRFGTVTENDGSLRWVPKALSE